MVTRISGLASGMDIDAMVKKLMQAERKPLDKLNQQKQLLEWKRESYRETSTKLVSFLQEKLSKLSLSSSISAQKANVSGNLDILSAVASSTASGTMEITVKDLATSSRAVTALNVDANGDSISFNVASSTLLSNLNPKILPGEVQVGEAMITVTAEDTIESFVKKINSSKEAGVTAIYDNSSGLSLTSKATGSAAIKLDANVASAFQLHSKAGTDAALTVNGLAITKSSNSFELNGVNITLKSKTPIGAITRIEVSKDTDKIVENVQSFVDAYNDVLALLNSKVGEERFRKYHPLSTEERAAMSDEEAKLWTSKAKSGMLKSDGILQDTITQMRTALMQGVDIGRDDGKPLILTELGITTGTYDTKGKLILDQDKLKKALEADPEIVSNFFVKKDPATALKSEYTQLDGVYTKLTKITNLSLQRMAETAGTSKVSSDLSSTFLNTSSMGEQLTSLDRRISDMTSRLNRIETNYFKKFSAMETAINRYNSTSSSLAGFMA
ncbi:flagellar capping protein [Paenibacillus algicola]|uniref:Flagellar hook-associated protein 2 n=1 Tax=Paenibacillus algicola TaxID=2565926 RepID=A0A4P8XQF8_9BACL|nr:flagellar filament capping protein FliD [Paenibacillus algicola]QCT04565.1 flagellar capping protein [Paenibacillus algicola]